MVETRVVLATSDGSGMQLGVLTLQEDFFPRERLFKEKNASIGSYILCVSSMSCSYM